MSTHQTNQHRDVVRPRHRLGRRRAASRSAQGRGGAGANNFYRFNYTLDEMQPIAYPGAADRHPAPDHAAGRDDQVHGPRRVHAHPQRHDRRQRGAPLLRLLRQGRSDRQGQAGRSGSCSTAGPGAATIWLHMGAFGPKVVKMNAERHGDAAALHLRGQSQLPARHGRPGLHRRDGHRLQPAGPADVRTQLRRRGQRPGGLRRVHPQLPERVRPMGIAALRRRRELRHDPRGRPGRLSHRPRLPDQRRDAALGHLRRQRERRHPAPARHAADRDHDRPLPQEARARSPEADASSRSRTGRASSRRASTWNSCSTGRARLPAQREKVLADMSRLHGTVEGASSTPTTCCVPSARSARSCSATST